MATAPPDTDGDGLTDDDEASVFGTNPLAADTDGDEFSNAEEVFGHGTDLFDPESRPGH